MTNKKSDLTLQRRTSSLPLVVAALLFLLPLAGLAGAQSGGTIDSGMNIAVRTNEEIKVSKSDGRVYSGEVEEDVRDTRGQVALPKGSHVELMVRSVADNEYSVDLESVSVDGRRLAVDAGSSPVSAEKKEGIGANSRTGKYVGGGAVIGAIVGAIAGGKKGAAIGAGVGAAGGAGTQILTRGKNLEVPVESLLTFRLEQPLRTGIADRGFSRNGRHYHDGYGTTKGNTSAYDAGLQAGRAARASNRTFDSRSTRWTGEELRDYETGYERGYDESPARNPQGNASIRLDADHYLTWRGPANSQVYVQVDNNQRRLFSSEASGSQPAPWIRSGHKYTFVLVDRSGREIARDENDFTRERRSAR